MFTVNQQSDRSKVMEKRTALVLKLTNETYLQRVDLRTREIIETPNRNEATTFNSIDGAIAKLNALGGVIEWTEAIIEVVTI
jgi:hypothetical protein